MKAACFAVILILAAALPVLAQESPAASVGLFLDGLRTSFDYWNPGTPEEITIYVFCRPSERGMMAAQFAIDYPANTQEGTFTSGPSVSVFLGDTLPRVARGAARRTIEETPARPSSLTPGKDGHEAFIILA